ncbi:ATP-dependent helicase [Hymenobacter defluvii]|uniref:ATP-dependent helicase n=2 Tax=Hymenobacter defluvii TaxID=2054411 RepID=A0ABS3TH28_9BACT|nr:ATP-dependent helicase [Hymenobacter defluvii]
MAGSDLAIVSAYFSIYAHAHLAEKLGDIQQLRFLFGEPNFVLDPSKPQRVFELTKDTVGLRDKLPQNKVARACYDWLKEKAEIRSMVKPRFLHGKLYHVTHPSGMTKALAGSSNFTAKGLGFGNVPNIELNLVVDSDRERRELLEWFDGLWNDETGLVEDVKDRVLDYLKQLFRENSPLLIYYKTLYEVLRADLAKLKEFSLLDDNLPTSFTQSAVWQKLYDFQKDGVKGAVQKMEQHGGCILADSVGLGKTFEALAVIKYYELKGKTVLVLCPKKLSENWTIYQAKKNSTLNPLQRDRLGYTVMYHTDLGRSHGRTGADGLDLTQLNWAAYDVVVVDESHNFRNNAAGRLLDDGTRALSRYEWLTQKIINAGATTKVLLLSATPVNNSLKDLRNQLYLISGSSDTALHGSTGVAHLGNTLAVAQRQFTQWADPRNADRSVRALLEKLDAGFFGLLDQLTIARSRRQIQQFYDMAAIGRFPTRRPPLTVSTPLDAKGEFPTYDQVNESILQFKLSLYNPSRFVQPAFESLYQEERVRNVKTQNFSQAKREDFLIGMMKVGFLKRLESSVESFEESMQRVIGKIDSLLARIDAYEASRSGGDFDPGTDLAGAAPADSPTGHDEQNEAQTDEQQALDAAFNVGGKKKFNLAHLKLPEWRKALLADRKALAALHLRATHVVPARDLKLTELKKLIQAKLDEPLNPGNRKVIVFTAYADTARYLYAQLHAHEWENQSNKLYTALVTGGTNGNQTTFQPAGLRHPTDFNTILTNFSPRSKGRAALAGMPQGAGEIDLLIATDCISEGQNLQDCDYLINYDIHWNPVRVIQRFGRIDRLGSVNETVQMVNFWPTNDLDHYLKLKVRVEARMALVDVTATGDDNLLAHTPASPDGSEIEELITEELKYRDQQLKRLRDETPDLEDLLADSGGVSLQDFSLEDFRLDLLRFLQQNEAMLAALPLGLHAVAAAPTGPHAHRRAAEYAELKETERTTIRPGVLYCLSHLGQGDQPETRNQKPETLNRLHPYYLVYLYDDGAVRFGYSQPRQVLEVMRLLCQGQTEADQELCDIFNKETDEGQQMDAHFKLLQNGIKATTTEAAHTNLRQLQAGRGQAVALPTSALPTNLADFELVTWLVIK